MMNDETKRAAILTLARGEYQRALLTGHARWSGGDLAGKAGRYGARYAASRASLLRRLRAAGYAAETRLVLEGTPRRQRRVLFVDGERW